MKLVHPIDVVTSLPDFAHTGFGLPFSERGVRYYQAAIDREIGDLSFGFADDQGLAAVVPCNTAKADVLSWYEFAIELWIRQGLSDEVQRRLAGDLLGTLFERAREAGAKKIVLRQAGDARFNAFLTARLLERGVWPESSFPILVDLAHDDATLMGALRSGHRQQVRQGSRILDLAFVDQSRPDAAAFDSFRELHARVAGRATRSRESWDRMFDLVAAGEGDLALAYWQGELLGGTLMLDAGQMSYYASGAYLREHFDKPITHFPLFQCILRARERGRTHAHLGEILPLSLADSKKELSINNFKLGFANSVTSSRIWTIPVGE